MRKTRDVRLAFVVLTIGAVVPLVAGISAALDGDWPRMSLYFFGSALVAFIEMSCLLGIKIDASFRHMERRFLGEHTAPPQPKCVAVQVLLIFMILSVVVHMSLAAIACLGEHWFRLGVHLMACAITVIVCTAVTYAVAIGARSRRFEKLLGRKEGQVVGRSE